MTRYTRPQDTLLAQKAAFNPGSGEAAEQPGADLKALLSTLWHGKLAILFFTLAAAGLSLYYNLNVAVPQYSATTRLALDTNGQGMLNLESVISGMSMDQSALKTELEVVKSRVVLDPLVESLNLIEDPEFNQSLQVHSQFSVQGLRERLLPRPPSSPEEILVDTIRTVQSAISVTALRDTFVFDIRVTTNSPEKSQLIANELSEFYIAYQVRVKLEATQYATNWLSDRVLELETDIALFDERISTLSAQSEMTSDESLDFAAIRLKQIRERLVEFEARSERITNLLSVGTAALNAGRSMDYLAIASQFDDVALKRFAPGAARDEADQQAAFLNRLRDLLANAQQDLTLMEKQKQLVLDSLTEAQAEFDQMALDFSELQQILREKKATQVLYETFLSRLKETSGQVGLQRPDSRVLSPAAPGDKISPRTTFSLFLAMIMGSLLGAGYALFQRANNNNVVSPSELEAISNLPVMGQTPLIPAKTRGKVLEYFRKNPTSAAAEAIRNIRTSILLLDVQNPPQVIMFTSSTPGEGKTTLALSLCLNMVGLGKKILLMEGDIRRRTLNQYFDVPATNHGLATILSKEQTLEEAIWHDEASGIDILLGQESTQNAADIFSSQAFLDVIAQARKTYDFIIIDTPPVLVVSDARILAGQCDAVIYAVRWNATHRQNVVEGLKQFESTGRAVDGLVMTQVNEKGIKRYGYDAYLPYSYQSSKNGGYYGA